MSYEATLALRSDFGPTEAEGRSQTRPVELAEDVLSHSILQCYFQYAARRLIFNNIYTGRL